MRPAKDRATEKTTVIKIGGASIDAEGALDALADLVATIHAAGAGAIVVHGGGREIAQLQDAAGLPTEKVDGLRVTSEDAMSLVSAALRGLVNTRLVGSLVARGHAALGLSGVDLGLLRSPFLDRKRLGRVGGPPRVDTARLVRLLEDGVLPVLAPVCLGPDGDPVNVNADTAARAVAAAMSADALAFVSDVPGVRTSEGIARTLSPDRIADLIADGTVSGGMVPKLLAAVAAVGAGVGRVRIGDLRSLADGTATEIQAKRAQVSA